MSDGDPNDGWVQHVVSRGETLSRIAQEYGVSSWREIYEHDRNAAFRSLRPDPNVIKPGDHIWVPVNGARTRPKINTGGSHKLRVRRVELALRSITVESDHHVLHDNKYRDDETLPDWARVDWSWSKNGKTYPKPDWSGGEVAPISHNRREQLSLKVALDVKIRKGGPLEGRLVGRAEGTLPKSFHFRSESLHLGAGEHELLLEAEEDLPDWPQHLADQSISWTFEARLGSIDVGTTGPHNVYVTFDTPIIQDKPEDGATVARMRAATRWVHAAGSSSSVELIGELFGRFSGYVLGFRYLSEAQRKSIESTPHLKTYMAEVDWPAFLHLRASDSAGQLQKQGGVWPLWTLEPYGGECQAMVRLVRAVLVQLGHGGTIETMYVNANAGEPDKAIIRDYGTGCKGPRSDRGYALVDKKVKVGRRYDTKGSQIGWNNYEAYMRYTYQNDRGQTFQAWYGGGIGFMGEVQRELDASQTAIRDSRLQFEQELIKVFEGLAEYMIVTVGTRRMREVTRYWSYRD